MQERFFLGLPRLNQVLEIFGSRRKIPDVPKSAKADVSIAPRGSFPLAKLLADFRSKEKKRFAGKIGEPAFLALQEMLGVKAASEKLKKAEGTDFKGKAIETKRLVVSPAEAFWVSVLVDHYHTLSIGRLEESFGAEDSFPYLAKVDGEKTAKLPFLRVDQVITVYDAASGEFTTNKSSLIQFAVNERDGLLYEIVCGCYLNSDQKSA